MNEVEFEIPSHETFASAYTGRAAWNIGRPQKAIVTIAQQVAGSVLDAGCGTGEHSLYFARRGHKVLGIDFVDDAIKWAKEKADDRGLQPGFLVMDALALKDLPEVFDTVIDSGLFHVFTDEDRRRYVVGLASVLRPGGKLFLLCFSDKEPGTHGPRRISRKELRQAFSRGWKIESIEPARFEVAANLKHLAFSEGGAKAWLAVISRH